jgi:hypothetical protein
MACEVLGWTEVPVRVIDLAAIVLGEHAENEMRKDFTPSERVAIGREVEAELGRRQGARTDTLPDNGPEVRGETRNIAGERAGFGSGKQYERAKAVVDHGAPELVDAMDTGKVSVTGAAIIAKQPADKQRRIVAEGKLKAAVSDLRAAERDYAKVKSLPKAPPPTEEEMAAHLYAFGTTDDRMLSSGVHYILEQIFALPEPAEAARRIPRATRYAIDVAAVRRAATWLNEFSDTWEREGFDVQEAAE